MRYIAFIHKDADSSYGVSFPDFPGCVSFGDTIDEALDNAVEALSLHADGMRADGIDLPQPSLLAQVQTLEDAKDASFAHVPLLQNLGKSKSITMSLDAGTLQAIDSEAKRRKMTRSAFIVTAAKHEIASNRH